MLGAQLEGVNCVSQVIGVRVGARQVIVEQRHADAAVCRRAAAAAAAAVSNATAIYTATAAIAFTATAAAAAAIAPLTTLTAAAAIATLITLPNLATPAAERGGCGRDHTCERLARHCGEREACEAHQRHRIGLVIDAQAAVHQHRLALQRHEGCVAHDGAPERNEQRQRPCARSGG